MPLNVASGLKTGLEIKIDNPRSLGSDLVANAVFALKNKKLPCIVIDMGTVTTFTVVDKKGTLIGTAIASGVKKLNRYTSACRCSTSCNTYGST